MYKIIGADQKEYGPVTSDQIRQWIRDGRVNAHTQTRLEPGGQWQPLSAFPEFADAFGVGAPGATATGPAPTPMPFPMGGGSREAALNAIKGPAIALIVTAALGIAYYLFNGVFTLVGGGPMFNQPIRSNISPEMRSFLEGMRGPMAGVGNLIVAAIQGFVLYGAIKMLRLQRYGLAFAACIVAMIPCNCCCLLGLPFGIWGLVILNKPEVKSHFTN